MLFSVLFVLAALGVGEASASAQSDSPNYRTLESVYGKLTKSRKALQAKSRLASFQEASPLSRFFRAAHADIPAFRVNESDCDVAFDFLILQDATGSFEFDYEVTANSTLPLLEEQMRQIAPTSKYSLVTFRDKPLKDLGEPTDDCFTVRELNVPNPTDLTETFLSDFATGGNDFPENQFGALMVGLQSPSAIPWHTDKKRIGVIFLITDAPPHFEEDNTSPVAGPLVPFGAEPYDEKKAEEYCKERGYPSANVVRQVLLDQHVYLGVAVMRADEPGKALDTWNWFNGFVGYPDSFVQAAAGDYSGWIEEFVVILKAIYDEHCGGLPTYFPTWTPPPSTTESPTTTTPAPEPTPVNPSPDDETVTALVPTPTTAEVTSRTVTPAPITTEEPTITTPVPEPEPTPVSPSNYLDKTFAFLVPKPPTTVEETSPTLKVASTSPVRTTGTPIIETSIGSSASADLPEANATQGCDCPSQPDGKPDPCCHRQPEVLIALMKQPVELDIHFQGFQPVAGDEEIQKSL